MTGASNTPEVICGVEDGWAGIRRFSLDVARSNRPIDVMICGALDPEVLMMITAPPPMRIAAVPRRLFRWRLLGGILRASIGGRLRWVVVTKARTRRLLGPVGRLLGARVVRLIETADGYRFEGRGPEGFGG